MERKPLHGWHWPDGDPAIALHATTAAGGLTIRHPGPDLHRIPGLVARLRKGARALGEIETRELTTLLGEICRRFLRRLDGGAVERAAANAGISPAMMREILEGMSATWNGPALRRLVEAEFPETAVLDRFVQVDGRMVRAAGPGCTVIVGAGTVPGVTITSMIRALLVRSAVLSKPGIGDVALTVRFARAAAAASDRLRGAVAVQYWPGGGKGWGEWEGTLFQAADQVVVHGGDATIEAVRARTPASTRLVEHSGRVGVAVIDPARAPRAAAEVARAATLFEQRGCVSTQLVLLLAGTGTPRPSQAIASAWCEELARRLAELESSGPASAPDPGHLSRIHQMRGAARLRRAAIAPKAHPRPQLWCGPDGRWTVILDRSERFEPCGGRTIWVAPVRDHAACLEALKPVGPMLQTVGLAGLDPEETGFTEALAEVGATRIVPIASVPFPESDWLQDGSRPLGELVRWCEVRRPPEAAEPSR